MVFLESVTNSILKLKEMQNYHGFAKYLKNTLWLFSGRILRMAVSLFVGIYVARYLGPSQYGLLSYAIAFVGLFSTLASLGLDNIVIRELVKTPQKRDELLGTAFILKLLGSVFMFGVILIAVHFTHNDSFTNLLVFIIAGGFIFQSFRVIDFYFQATVKSKYTVQAQLIQMAVSSIAKLVLIWISAPLMWFAVVSLADSIVLAIGLAWNYVRKAAKILAWRPRLRTAVKLLKDSWPLILSGVAIMIYMRIDQVMIKAMMGTKEVGYYAVAVRLGEAWYFVPMAVTSSLFPAIINAKKVSEELYYSRLQQLYDLMVWLAVAIALPTTFLAPWIIKVLFGNAYLPAGSVLRIYIWAGVFVSLGVANSKWLLSENLQVFSATNTTIGAIVNVLLNYIFIKNIGVGGAAWATLISHFIADYLSLLFFKKTRGGFFRLSRSLLLVRNLSVKKAG